MQLRHSKPSKDLVSRKATTEPERAKLNQIEPKWAGMSEGDSQSEAVLSQNVKIWYFLSQFATRLYVD